MATFNRRKAKRKFSLSKTLRGTKQTLHHPHLIGVDESDDGGESQVRRPSLRRPLCPRRSMQPWTPWT